VICGHVARSKIRKSDGLLLGKAIATAGLILGYIGLALGILDVPLLVSMIQSERERLHHLAIERKQIASDDGKLKVTTSGFWVKRSGLNKEASLQAAYKDKEMYVIVITDAKADLDNFTLEKHHKLTRDRMLQKLRNASATKPVPLTIDGHPALQDELTGTEDDTNVIFLHTTVDDGDHFQPRMLSGDAQVALATTEPTAARNYREFSQREINGDSNKSRNGAGTHKQISRRKAVGAQCFNLISRTQTHP
jgi:hypothetical protein